MQIIRTILWVLLTAALVAFIAMNWTKVPVNFWPLDDGNYMHFEWPVGVIALVFFLLGAVPMWLVWRAARWRLNRRIQALDNSVRASSAASPSHALAPMPAATSKVEPAAWPAATSDPAEPPALDPDSRSSDRSPQA